MTTPTAEESRAHLAFLESVETFVNPLVQATHLRAALDREAAALARAEKAEHERELLALIICGGEDAPGHANSLSVTRLEIIAQSERLAQSEAINRRAKAEAERDAARAEVERLREAHGWRPIETAPKDGRQVDLWGINHLHYAKPSSRITGVSWGRVTDWMGRERDDWRHGHGEDFEPTHWMPLPADPALASEPGA